jgi:hypothetical protein
VRRRGEAAFKERVKIHDLVLAGIGLALRKRGYPAMEETWRARFESTTAAYDGAGSQPSLRIAHSQNRSGQGYAP